MIRATGAKLCMLASESDIAFGLFLEREHVRDGEDSGEGEGIAIRSRRPRVSEAADRRLADEPLIRRDLQMRDALHRYMWKCSDAWCTAGRFGVALEEDG